MQKVLNYKLYDSNKRKFMISRDVEFDEEIT